MNLCEHDHNYTALHFAGLSGNREVCQTLLSAGAKPDVTNSVGRTPSQMASFVGNHACVATILTHVSKSEIDRFVSQDKLSSTAVDNFHKFVTSVNLHPVRVALNLHTFRLGEHLKEIAEALDAMRTNEMKKGAQTNEVMAFKYHYLYFIVSEIAKVQKKLAEKPSEGDGERKSDPIELFAKKLLKTGKDGNFDFMESFLREAVREFPYRETTIFRHFVTSLAAKDPPAALSIISAAVHGHRGFFDTIPTCSSCGEEKPAKKCSKCKVVQYCDRNCQRLHWPVHKKECARLSQGVSNEPQTQAKPDVAEITSELQKLIGE